VPTRLQKKGCKQKNAANWKVGSPLDGRELISFFDLSMLS